MFDLLGILFVFLWKGLVFLDCSVFWAIYEQMGKYMPLLFTSL